MNINAERGARNAEQKCRPRAQFELKRWLWQL